MEIEIGLKFSNNQPVALKGPFLRPLLSTPILADLSTHFPGPEQFDGSAVTENHSNPHGNAAAPQYNKTLIIAS
jgi:hypothetical protein